MEYEYPTSVGYKIFYGIAALTLIGFTAIIPMTGKNGGYEHAPGLLIWPLIGVAGGVLIIINLVKRKITISDDRLTRTNVWGLKEILFKDIRGFRIGDKAIYIYPLQEDRSKLSINDYTSIADVKGLQKWLSENFTDLNIVEFEQAKSKILEDSTLGITKEDREAIYSSRRKYTVWYSMVGLLFFILIAYIHTDNKILPLILFVYPILGFWLMANSKGLIRFFAKKNSAYISISFGLLFPALALSVQSIINTKFLDFDNLWLPVAIAVIVIVGLVYFTSIKKSKESLLAQLFFALIFAVAYGFGGIAEINCGFDQSKPQIYPVKVIDHYINHGKSTSYHLTINEWRAGYSSENITVSESFYDNVDVGSTVNVNLKPGVLNIPWYYISQ